MNILIACKLPHGIKFKGSDGEYITINGANTALLHGAPGLTDVDESEWALFTATHTDFEPLLNNAIYTCGNNKVADIAAMTNDLSDEKTGFEGLNPIKPGKDLVPQDEVAVKKALNVENNRPNQTRKPGSKAAKAASLELAQSLGDK